MVEDDAEVARQIAAALRSAGYAVDVAADGPDALFRGETEPYDAIVLDLGLPGMDGVTVLERLRQGGVRIPVLILIARGTWREKVTGLRAGADDYLAKPFEMEELLARVEALLRRAAGHASPVLAHGGLRLDTSTQRVSRAGSPVELTEHLYEQDFDRDSNVIEVLVNRLRKKLGAWLIVTRRGQGYQLSEADDAP